jgi:hypothetical protein
MNLTYEKFSGINAMTSYQDYFHMLVPPVSVTLHLLGLQYEF